MSRTKTDIALRISGLAAFVLAGLLAIEIAVVIILPRYQHAAEVADRLNAAQPPSDISVAAALAINDLLPGVKIVLPAGNRMGVRWVLPPSIDGRTNEIAWEMAVATNGVVWLKEDDERLLCPERGVIWTLPKPAACMAVVRGNGLLLADGQSLEFPVAPSQPTDTRVTMQPITTLPIPAESLATAGDDLYFAGFNRERALHEVYRLAPEKDPGANGRGLRRFRRRYASLNPITAVAGKGDEVLVAQGREIIRSLPDGQRDEIVFRHPEADIAALAYSAETGLFFATATTVGYVGDNGWIEFLNAPEPQIAAQGTNLYVFVPTANRAVFAVTGVDALKTLPLRGRLKSEAVARLVNTEFRAFDAENAVYENSPFPTNIVRVAATYDLQPRSGQGSQTGLVSVAWLSPFGDVMATGLGRGLVGGTNQWQAQLGYDEPGAFLPGHYHLAVHLDGKMVDRAAFSVGSVQPIQAAIQQRDLAALRRALDDGGDPNEALVIDETRVPVLHLAVQRNWPAGVALLLSRRADANARDYREQTPLFSVLTYGDDEDAALEIAALLVRHGADVNARDVDGDTPLYMAGMLGRAQRIVPRYVSLLIDAKADVNAINKSNMTILLGHLYSAEYPDVIRLLCERGARLRPEERYRLAEPAAQKLCPPEYVREVFEKDDSVVLGTTECELPWLRALIIRRLLQLSRDAIPSAATSADYQRALTLCRQAEARAEGWQLEAAFPEIKRNIALLAGRKGG